MLLDPEELKKEIRTKTIKKAAEFLKNIDTLIEDRLEASVRAILGFSKKSWGDDSWEVDHCNGRISSVSEIINSEAQDAVKTCVEKVITPELVEDAFKACHGAVVREFRERFQRNLKNRVLEKLDSLVEEKATELVNECLLETGETDTYTLAEPDLRDPQTGGGDAFEQAVVERKVKKALI